MLEIVDNFKNTWNPFWLLSKLYITKKVKKTYSGFRRKKKIITRISLWKVKRYNISKCWFLYKEIYKIYIKHIIVLFKSLRNCKRSNKGNFLRSSLIQTRQCLWRWRQHYLALNKISTLKFNFLGLSTIFST